MILGLIKPTSGIVQVFGKNIEEHRAEVLSRINYASTYIQFMSRLTVRENLKVFALLYNVSHPDKKVREIAEELELDDLLGTLFFKLSSGQKTRVVFAKTLLNDPEFLLLDEPTASLDPDIAFKVREVLRRIHRNRKVAMLYTSHNMVEVEEMCERIIFLQKGKIVAEGTPDELKKTVRDYTIEVRFNEERQERMREFLKSKGFQFIIETPGVARINANAENMALVIKQVSSSDFGVYDFDINKPDLEEVFLKLAKG
jgi:ABC-2 type transport system ATP-binding protein